MCHVVWMHGMGRVRHPQVGEGALVANDPTRQPPAECVKLVASILCRFVASLALHEGALVANYPMDGYPDGSFSAKRVKQASPDDAAFMYMAGLYARGHKTMALSKVREGVRCIESS